MLDAVNDNVPGLRQTPSYVSNEEFKKAVLQSSLLPLFEVKGTTINKSYGSNLSVGLRSKENIEHGEHTDLTSCGKCTHFLEKYVNLTNQQISELQEETTMQYKSSIWSTICRKIRTTANS